MKLSVIIANYNYRDFIGAAINSALAVDWPDRPAVKAKRRANLMACRADTEGMSGPRQARLGPQR